HGPAPRTTPDPTTPARPGLGARMRVRPAGAVPRGHVLRELGLAREQSAANPGAGAADDADRALAAVAAVPGLRHGYRLPAGPRPAPAGPRHRARRLHRHPLPAAAAAAGVRHGGGGGAPVLLRGGRAVARRLPRGLSRVLGALPPGRRQLLRCRWLPGPADLEPPVVRRLPVGIHGGAVAGPGAWRAR